jgi:hypothetical protein
MMKIFQSLFWTVALGNFMGSFFYLISAEQAEQGWVKEWVDGWVSEWVSR